MAAGARFHAMDEARDMARRNLPAMIFDYVDGTAGSGYSERANREALHAIRLRQRALCNVETRSIASSLFGRETGLPFSIAPMGFCNTVKPGADLLLAAFAARHRVPVCVSTAATTPLEKMIERAQGNAWFQLYYTRDQEAGEELVRRAEVSGYDTLVLTVDVPEVGRRPRELRHGFQLPFAMTPGQWIDSALHPRWSLAMAAGGMPRLANFDGSLAKFDRSASRAGADWEYLSRLRDRWKGKLVVKGVLDSEDALRIRQAGADAIQISSHGGRQMDSAPLPVHALTTIREAVGATYPLFFDSGVRTGEDIVKLHALGADFVFIGRPFLYAIAAAGKAGPDIAADILSKEISITLAMIGRTGMSGLDREVLAD
ncbi:MAG: alpha-hydroxy acid oxidase [Rhizobiaceae bacterium]